VWRPRRRPTGADGGGTWDDDEPYVYERSLSVDTGTVRTSGDGGRVPSGTE